MSITTDIDAWIDAAEYFGFEGHRIAFWVAGQGAPLLLVHGYPTSTWDWHHVWDALSGDRTLVACDMLGFGLSDKPRSGYSIHRQAAVQQALLDHLGMHAFDAVFHDYGDTVGQEMLAQHNAGAGFTGLRRAAFLNGGLFPEQHRMRPIQKLGTGPLGFIVSLLMNRQRFGAAFSEVFAAQTQPGEAELDEHWRMISNNGGHRLTHTLLHYIADRREHRERWVGALQNSRVPVKLVCGGADPVSGRHMFEYFRELVPGAEATCFDDVGHYPQLEAPARVLAGLLPFLGDE